MIANRKKHLLLWLRLMNLQCMVIAFRAYGNTKDKQFYEYTQWFGQQSKELKNECGRIAS